MNAGEQMKGHLQVDLVFFPPDCSNINIYVCIHTYAEYSSRQGGVYTHTHTNTVFFQTKLPKRWVPGSESGQQPAMLSDHSKWKIPSEQDRPRSLPREGSRAVTYPDELQSHHHLRGVFLDEITGLAPECSKGRGGLEVDRNG